MLFRSAKLKMNAQGSIEYTNGDMVVKMDSRKPSFWEENVMPIFKTAAQNTQANI